jgi:hypothetical protein
MTAYVFCINSRQLDPIIPLGHYVSTTSGTGCIHLSGRSASRTSPEWPQLAQRYKYKTSGVLLGGMTKSPNYLPVI